MVTAVPFIWFGAKMYSPVVSQVLTTNLLSCPKILHDDDIEIFKGCKIQVQEGCSHKVIPVFFFPDLLLSAVKLNLKPAIYASSMKILIFNIIFDTLHPTKNTPG